MSNIIFKNEDCMDVMDLTSDKHFSLACVDAPVLIGADGKSIDPDLFFNELKRVSKHQIIFDANFCRFLGKPFKTPFRNELADWITDNPTGWVIVDTGIAIGCFGMIWTSLDIPTVVMKCETRTIKNAIHSLQKPEALYKYLFELCIWGGPILETHGGSMTAAVVANSMCLDMTICEMKKETFDKGVAYYEKQIFKAVENDVLAIADDTEDIIEMKTILAKLDPTQSIGADTQLKETTDKPSKQKRTRKSKKSKTESAEDKNRHSKISSECFDSIDDLTDAAVEKVKEYEDMQEAILSSYKIDPDAFTELKAAQESLENGLKRLELTPVEDNVSDLIIRLKALNPDKYERQQIVSELVVTDNCSCIATPTMDQKAKLEEFVKTEMYPFYIDQNDAIIF